MHDGESTTTTDHATIRKWAEARDGRPAAVRQTHGDDDAGILRIEFAGGEATDSLEDITWEDFFDKFEQKKLAFLYQDKTKDGGTSRFFKLVGRDS